MFVTDFVVAQVKGQHILLFLTFSIYVSVPAQMKLNENSVDLLIRQHIFFMDREDAEMYCIKCFLSWRDVAWLCYRAGVAGSQLLLCVAPLGCAVLHQETSAPVSLGLRPLSHLGHREKECADLMMYRKSENHTGIPELPLDGSVTQNPAHSELQPHTKRRVETQYADPLRVSLHRDTFCTPLLLAVPLLQSPLQRSKRSQRVKIERN